MLLLNSEDSIRTQRNVFGMISVLLLVPLSLVLSWGEELWFLAAMVFLGPFDALGPPRGALGQIGGVSRTRISASASLRTAVLWDP